MDKIRHSRTGRRRHRTATWRRWLGPVGALAMLALVVVAYRILLGGGAVGAGAELPAAATAAPPERTASLPPLNLPRDDAPHATATEWWYYNGHLMGADGNRYSFHATVFIRDGMVRHTVFHGSLNDYRHDRRHSHQLRTAGIPLAAVEQGFDFQHEGWRVAGTGGRHALKMAGDGFALDLALDDAGTPVLHKAKGSTTPGLLDFGAAGISYYYSRPRMQATGVLRVDSGAAVKVKGEVWFDHQWGNFEASRLAWNWFALQLDDGTSLTVNQLFDREGRPVLVYGTRTEGARSRALGADEIRLVPSGVWRSPRSGVRYPAGWTLNVGGEQLTITPLRVDSEFNGLATTFAQYWEGGVRVSGAKSGLGFLEMSGYDHVPAVQPGG
ncbi:MAG: hypothetical protein J0M28_14405 [Thauera sp.]|nr:hypothetical protein [Thauera sp.]